MITQCYKIRVQEPEKVKPAQAVYLNNDSDEVIGFISSKDGNYAIICLFFPSELPINATNIRETLTP